MKLIDTHCHLYAEDFKEDIAAVIDSAKLSGVQKFYLPAIDRSSADAMLSLENQYPSECKAMMGLHPCSVKEDYMEELAFAEEWLSRRPFAAIGEAGLDFYWDTSFVKQQSDAFAKQMEWALSKDLPIVIHTRNAMQETIELVKPYAEKGLRGIFHCFSGTSKDAEIITEMGFYLGIGGVLTYKNSGLAQAIENIAIRYLLLETDAPYLSPVPFRGKRNESSYLRHIVSKLSEVKKVSVEEMAATTSANAEKIFGN